jgi:hypothetical protein
MDQILKAHDLNRDDVEPETLQKCISGVYNTDDMERIARVSSTNKKLKIKGLPGLLFSQHPILLSPETSADQVSTPAESPEDDSKSLECAHSELISHISDIALKSMSESELKVAETAGLTAAEYFVVKGSYGSVLGLNLDMGAYKGAFSKCKTKHAIKLKDDRENSKKFVFSQIITIAKRKLKSNQIKSLYSQEENSMFDLKTPISKSIHRANMLLKTIIQPIS